MATRSDRRSFLNKSATSLVALGSVAKLGDFNVSQARAPASRRATRDLESLMRLIESTPRYKIAPVIVDQLRKGLTRDDLLEALLLTTTRISAGHKLWVHHSVAELSSRVAREDRLLPLFWHIDLIKAHGTTDAAPILKDSQLPNPAKAAALFEDAVQARDQDAASAAIIAIARSEGPKVAFRYLWPSAAGPLLFGSAGHTVIRVANTWRSLERVGWHYAERPLYRFARVASTSSTKILPKNDLHLVNARRAAQHGKLPGDWMRHHSDAGAVVALHALFREAGAADACDSIFEQLRSRKLTAGSIWDAVFLTTNELSARFKLGGLGGRPRHSITASNALHYMYLTWTDPKTRLFTVLQTIGMICSFVDTLRRAGELNDLDITKIADAESPASAEDAVADIFSLLPPRRFEARFRDVSGQHKAMQLTYAMAQKHSDQAFLRTAQKLLCLKNGIDAHHLKFSIAAFENYQHVSPIWRPNHLAASVFVLQGTQMEDNAAVAQAREALRSL